MIDLFCILVILHEVLQQIRCFDVFITHGSWFFCLAVFGVVALVWVIGIHNEIFVFAYYLNSWAPLLHLAILRFIIRSLDSGCFTSYQALVIVRLCCSTINWSPLHVLVVIWWLRQYRYILILFSCLHLGLFLLFIELLLETFDYAQGIGLHTQALSCAISHGQSACTLMPAP